MGFMSHCQLPETETVEMKPTQLHVAESSRHWSVSHYISLKFILILVSYLRLSLPSSLLPSGILTKSLYVFLASHACYMPRQSHTP